MAVASLTLSHASNLEDAEERSGHCYVRRLSAETGKLDSNSPSDFEDSNLSSKNVELSAEDTETDCVKTESMLEDLDKRHTVLSSSEVSRSHFDSGMQFLATQTGDLDSFSKLVKTLAKASSLEIEDSDSVCSVFGESCFGRTVSDCGSEDEGRESENVIRAFFFHHLHSAMVSAKNRFWKLRKCMTDLHIERYGHEYITRQATNVAISRSSQRREDNERSMGQEEGNISMRQEAGGCRSSEPTEGNGKLSEQSEQTEGNSRPSQVVNVSNNTTSQQNTGDTRPGLSTTRLISVFLVMLTAGSWFVEAAKDEHRGLRCPPCQQIHCAIRDPKELGCPGGITTGVCGCCPVCARLAGQACGGDWSYLGKCDKGLTCRVPALPTAPMYPLQKEPAGVCLKEPSGPHQQADAAFTERCRPLCTPQLCSRRPRAVCSARNVAEIERPCQGTCQHTSCRACAMEEETECVKCSGRDFRCLKQFGRCVARKRCQGKAGRKSCRKTRFKEGPGRRFVCKVPDCPD